MELFVEYPEQFNYESASAGPVLQQANKELIVQTPEPGRLRIVALSAASAAELASGKLLTLRFSGDAAGGAVRFAEQTQVFAPLAANEGLLMGEPLPL